MEGLTYMDVVVGPGETAVKGDVVDVHYTGWVLTEGVKAPEPFDSSVARGESAKFDVGVGRLIKGWDEGIPGMQVGGKRELTIAPDLAYGTVERPNIPANSTLFFEVELLGIVSVEIVDTLVGEGAVAEIGDTVTVHYTGWLCEDGARVGDPFDSSFNRDEPYRFPLGKGRVIKGWDQGVKGMKTGGKRTLIIPPDLGYGARGAGGVIPPNATLIFDVELVSIEGK
ncbi:FKBP-type peptidyl-prolyl cis-trans isomerase [bacterium]|nr:FKBP-type peptidyl-prolyl cis-trans isomerase [bacterium]MBU1072107.1 FKBP-type peptidyl-prolyl cis-trans isomerase [bacterium]MBU1675959.1 FKBP-type peptidyl-prolyl cis-trans isomerase [bacterium]